MDDPPPYPGEPPGVSEEKQPLNPTQLCVAIDGPEDVASPVTFSLSRCSPPRDVPSSSSCSCSPSALVGPHRQTPHRHPHRCYHDHVTIFSNLGALEGLSTSGHCRNEPSRQREGIRFKKENKDIVISHSNKSQGAAHENGGRGQTTEQLRGLPSTSSGHYRNIDDFLTNGNGFTTLARSHTFSLQERGDIELTTFRGSPSDDHGELVKPERRSIELGSFFRSPLGEPPVLKDLGLVCRSPAEGACDSSRGYKCPTSLQNGALPVNLSPDAANEENNDDLTDPTIQVIPQG